jgi:hypothetical protein
MAIEPVHTDLDDVQAIGQSLLRNGTLGVLSGIVIGAAAGLIGVGGIARSHASEKNRCQPSCRQDGWHRFATPISATPISFQQISPRTVKRNWAQARAWLGQALAESRP